MPVSLLHFSKYTSCGNNFTLLDEAESKLIREQWKREFARYATDVNFGIGSDNLLVLEQCTPEALSEIVDFSGYWDETPGAESADYLFRMFEPDGSEALCCGNGLLCMAKHLYDAHGVDAARIMTELPSKSPKVVSIGTRRDDGRCWVKLGNPRKATSDLADTSTAVALNDSIDVFEQLKIQNFRQADGERFLENLSEISLRGYLVQTGEPHLVMFTDTDFSISGITDLLFGSVDHSGGLVNGMTQRRGSGMAFIRFIGKCVTREFADIFPQGVSINFVRALPDGKSLEYRTFERGIEKETLACGTGALAAAYVAKQLGMVHGDEIRVLPHRCRWQKHDAEILIRRNGDGWSLLGDPFRLFNGAFEWRVQE